MKGVAIVSFAVCHGLWAVIVFRKAMAFADTRGLLESLFKAIRSLIEGDRDFVTNYIKLLGRVAVNVIPAMAALSLVTLPLIPAWGFVRISFWLFVSVSSVTSILFLLAVRRPQVSESSLSIDDSQFFFLSVAEIAPGLIATLSSVESSLLARRLGNVTIADPVFISGLARSGTTMLLELMAQVNGVATHRYRDFPLVTVPWIWGKFYSLFGTKTATRERAHKDGVYISPESPEALEEPIWQKFFPQTRDPIGHHVLGPDTVNSRFGEFFIDHIRKILCIRNGSRYVSKGNYNVTRIEYLGRLFPNALFVVPIRHPISHVQSLVRQHELFCQYASTDDRVGDYLKAAGHFEFGPQRIPISIEASGRLSLDAWEQGDEAVGYAYQWTAIYRYVGQLLSRQNELSSRIVLVRYEDFCGNPVKEFKAILKRTKLLEDSLPGFASMSQIRQCNAIREDDHSARVWELTRAVAADFGYERRG